MTIYARPVGVHSYTLKRCLYQPKNKKSIHNPTQDSSFVSVHTSSRFPTSLLTNFSPSHALLYLSETPRDPIESSHSSSSLDTRRFYLIRRPDARATGQCGRAEYFRHRPSIYGIYGRTKFVTPRSVREPVSLTFRTSSTIVVRPSLGTWLDSGRRYRQIVCFVSRSMLDLSNLHHLAGTRSWQAKRLLAQALLNSGAPINDQWDSAQQRGHGLPAQRSPPEKRS